jgi:ketosteroid isomerase-like protein
MHERRNAEVQRQAGPARAPEELSTQLEDAFILRQPGALAELFDVQAVPCPPDCDVDVRGSEAIASFAAKQWAAERRYLAQIRRVVQAGDTAALLLDWSLTPAGPSPMGGEHGRGVEVLRRGSDGAWRYLISLLHVCEPAKGEQP